MRYILKQVLSLALPLLLTALNVPDGKAQGLDKVRKEALAEMRIFRDSIYGVGLEKSPAGGANDSLLQNTLKWINVTKSISDTAQLISIKKYFARANKAFLRQAERKSLIKVINKDIALKLEEERDKLNLEHEVKFSVKKNVKVQVSIDGVKPALISYRLFWATFIGQDLKELISSNSFEGTSIEFSQPMELEVDLPGYITFWLSDGETQRRYKSDLPYLILHDNKQVVAVNFIPL